MSDIVQSTPRQHITRANATRAGDPTIAAIILRGDTSGLTPDQKVEYYQRLCAYLDLDPVTRPFEFVRLPGRGEILYATKACTDQLRYLHGISVERVTREVIDGVLIVTATGRMGDRTDSATGCVYIEGLRGEQLANAMMKAETKAKRRLTLSLAGLGVVDESEVDSIPGAQRVATTADTAAASDGQPSAVARLNARISGSRTLPQRSEAVRDATPASDSPPDSPPEPEAVEAEAWGEVGPETPATPATSPPTPPPPTATTADREREEAAARLREIVESWSGCKAGSRQFGLVARYILQQATGRVVREATTQDLHAALVWANTHRGTDILAAAMQAQQVGAQ